MNSGQLLLVGAVFIIIALLAWRDIKRYQVRKRRDTSSAGFYAGAVGTESWTDGGTHCSVSDSGGDCGGGSGDSGGGSD
ncbi:hypothetical protein ACVFVO_10250 [Advenella kashmirensis]